MDRSDPCALSEAERWILERLDELLRNARVRAALSSIVERVGRTLSRGSDAIEAWEPVPIELYGEGLPPDVGSSWVFILRRGVTTGAERHPNSRQRMVSWSGGVTSRCTTASAGGHIPSPLPHGVSSAERWLSIPPWTWHQGVVGDEDWVVVSFHTVPAGELIEERPDPEDPDPFHPRRTRRRKYVEVQQA